MSGGRYEGKIQADWTDGDRIMILSLPITFIDKNGEHWPVPAGAHIDGASIPRFLWSITGAPYSGRYRKASVIHDWYCSIRTRTSDATHTMFYEAMLVSGVSRNKAGIMYAAVRYAGPKWTDMDIANNNLASKDRFSQHKSIRHTAPFGGEVIDPGSKSYGAGQDQSKVQLPQELRSEMVVRAIANEEEFRRIADKIEADKLDTDEIDKLISDLYNDKTSDLEAAFEHFRLAGLEDIGRTKKPELERRILRDVGSYGRQIGRLSEALAVLIEQSDLNRTKLNDAQIAALHDFSQMVEEIKRCKRD